ncbi:MAG TPA: nucleotidyltransferase domain-containing protein [Thermoanaerobaculia bacterium]|jgi:hypothetical protein|nr:nucleotidyltransferase domain-containing protein [Thermoanaerobaculia bacterium]
MTVDEIVRNRLGVDPEQIAEFCRKWAIKEMWLLGSALRDDFRADSDIDLLVTFENPHRDFGPWMSELQDMQQQLESLFGRPVDLVQRESVERSQNYIRRRSILKNLVPLYVA